MCRRPPLLTSVRGGAVLALAGLVMVVATVISPDPLRAENPQLEPHVADAAAGLDEPQYPLGGHIIWRQRDSGAVEFCFEPHGQDMVCPDSRFTRPERLRTDRWTRSSEIAWNVPLDPQRIADPPAVSPETGSCDADLDRMFAATWKVATTSWLGSAFHIGGGRFVTAHHVVDGVPPVLTLTHGDRSVAAVVLGSDPEHDVALLEAFDPLEILDVPSVAFRNPTPSDVGEPVYLVGYPSAGALTAATGVITRVWEDEILTNSSSRGGNSGGPMFDACGDVLGVLWAGSGSRNLSHSGEVLRSTLEGLDQPPPALPAPPAGIVIPDGVVIWHYGPEPPADVDCVGAEGDWWVGVAGRSWGQIQWSEPSTGRCGYGITTVIAFRNAPQAAGDGGLCPRQPLPRPPVMTSVLHESSEEFGETVLGAIAASEWCPDHYTHELHVRVAVPGEYWQSYADLIGANGQVIAGQGPMGSRGWWSDAYSDDLRELRQRWRVPAGFEPAAFRVVLAGQSWRVEIEPPPPGHQVEQRARIAVRANPSGAGAETCLLFENGALACPSRAAPQGGPDPAGWQRSGALIWSTAVGPEHAPEPTGCALTADLGTLAWQVSALGGAGSALYVGRNQFITASRLFSDETPWGVVSQGEIALPVARVATDSRNGLALVEVIGQTPALLEQLSAPFARSTEEAADSEPVLVAYPWGEADRFAMTRLRVTEVTDRLLQHNGWGWDRAGAPIVDPCTRRVIGISTGSNEALRAETAVAALRELRRQRVAVQAPVHGPALHGSIALLPGPVYLGTEQPGFGAWICNIRPSTRFDIVYAVYLVSTTSSDLTSVVDGERRWPSQCGGSGKVITVEFQSDQAPSLLCAEPSSPRSPRSTIDLSLVAPPGTQLLQATEFNRWSCPGLDTSDYWASTHFLRLRFPQLAEFDDVTVQLEDASGARHDSVGRGGDVDPDVGSWRFNLAEAEPVRLIVSIPGQETAVPPPAVDDKKPEPEPEPTCVEDLGPSGDGVISATLYHARIPIGEVMIVRYGAPIRCPWFHTHGVVVTLADPVAESTHPDASLIAADATVLASHWSGRASRYTDSLDAYTWFRQAFEVPDDFVLRAVEIRVGERRWIIILDETDGN